LDLLVEQMTLDVIAEGSRLYEKFNHRKPGPKETP